jgi:hypothetical protein
VFVQGTSGAATLGTLPLSQHGKPVALLTGAAAGPAQLSPDDRWMTYFSRESGRSEVYVTSYPKVVGRWRVSTDGGSQARWRRDGKEIFYISRDAKLMAAEVSAASDSFQMVAVRPLFPIRPASTRWDYDVSPDGQRFIVNMRVPQEAPTAPLTVLVNWPAAVGR